MPLPIDEKARCRRPRSVVLEDAIADAPPDRLRWLLLNMARKKATNASYLRQYFLRPTTQSRSGAFGYRPRYEICDHCKREYEVVVDTGDFPCHHHTGDKQLKDDSYLLEMSDEEDHPDPDRFFEARRMLEEAGPGELESEFTWTCCDREGSHKGCVRSKHSPKLYRDFVSKGETLPVDELITHGYASYRDHKAAQRAEAAVEDVASTETVTEKRERDRTDEEDAQAEGSGSLAKAPRLS